jgi:DNA-binding YbaB/EbfC family protein
MNQQQARMLKQLQQMQQKMAEAQEKLASETVEASAGGRMVTAVVSGTLELKELRINPDAVDPEDVEMLQDMVTAAVNEAMRGAQDLANRLMGQATAGMQMPNIPGMF